VDCEFGLPRSESARTLDARQSLQVELRELSPSRFYGVIAWFQAGHHGQFDVILFGVHFMYHEIERGCDEAILIGEMIVRVVDVAGTRVTLAVSRPDGGPRYQEIVVNLAEEQVLAFSPEHSSETFAAR
jgi:hypothetical protein